MHHGRLLSMEPSVNILRFAIYSYLICFGVLLAACDNQPLATGLPSVINATEEETPAQIFNITSAPAPHDPTFSNLIEQLPAGTYIAYVHEETLDATSKQSLHLMGIDGKEYGQLLGSVATNITIAPNWQYVVFPLFLDYGNYQIAFVDLKNKHSRFFNVPNCLLSNDKIAWSPDSQHLAVSCGHFISIIAIDEEDVRTSTSLHLSETDESIIDPEWSPDGKYLSFFITNFNSAQDTSAHGPNLIEAKCPGNSITCDIKPTSFSIGEKDSGISLWTPENLLATVQNNQIIIYDPMQNSPIKTIKISSETPIFSFIWSPDNQWIAYESISKESAHAVYLLPTQGGEPVLISENGGKLVFWLTIGGPD